MMRRFTPRGVRCLIRGRPAFTHGERWSWRSIGCTRLTIRCGYRTGMIWPRRSRSQLWSPWSDLQSARRWTSYVGRAMRRCIGPRRYRRATQSGSSASCSTSCTGSPGPMPVIRLTCRRRACPSILLNFPNLSRRLHIRRRWPSCRRWPASSRARRKSLPRVGGRTGARCRDRRAAGRDQGGQGSERRVDRQPRL